MLPRSCCQTARAIRASRQGTYRQARGAQAPRSCLSPESLRSSPFQLGSNATKRRYYSDHVTNLGNDQSHLESALARFKSQLYFPAATANFRDLVNRAKELKEKQVTLHGYLGTRRDAGKSLTFAELHDSDLRSAVQLVAAANKDDDGPDSAFHQIRSLQEHTPVAIIGSVKSRKLPKGNTASNGTSAIIPAVEIAVEHVMPLNEFPQDIIMQPETVIPPEQRHLQLRNDYGLRVALAFRSRVAQVIRDELCAKQDFIEVETPILFKSTPEGAREFLVPTRSPGLAYALPQSPQQYKQILMASGIPRYMQIAKCFRDEDLRADRQPEFTQVDLEMAFADGQVVMKTVETLIKRLWKDCLGIHLPDSFQWMTYDTAMSEYGSDKPDLRFGSRLHRIDWMLPVDLVQKIYSFAKTDPAEPIVEVMKFSISDDPKTTRNFISTFMDSPEALPFVQNPEGQPGIFIFDSRQPLQGLQPFGFEAAEQVEELLELQDGDLVVLQARRNYTQFSGSSTPMGNLRLALHRAAVRQSLMKTPTGFEFTWVTHFPLFDLPNDTDPGQGGAAGFSSTHHPFTAPLNEDDADLLLENPIEAEGDHYDLVVNGVELGGGSRRIHDAKLQEYILKDVLKMSDERMKDFEHLLQALRAGCPPHAGIALGFDRLIAVMLGKESVRDVIAFPKSGKGEDMLVKSPTRMTEDQLKTYHLRLRE